MLYDLFHTTLATTYWLCIEVAPGPGPQGPKPLSSPAARPSSTSVPPQREHLRLRVSTAPVTTVAEKILEIAYAVDADLIVMGAYGHSRLRELVLGGATQDLLQDCDVAVLMVH